MGPMDEMLKTKARKSTCINVFGDNNIVAGLTEVVPFVHCALFEKGLCGHETMWSCNPLDVRWPDPYDPTKRGLCRDCWQRRVQLIEQGREEPEDPGEVDTSPLWIARHDDSEDAARKIGGRARAKQGAQRRLAVQAPPAIRVLCYGDSLTAGYCPLTAMLKKQTTATYAETLQERLQDQMGTDVEVIVCGVVGFTTKALLENADRPRFLDSANREVAGLSALLQQQGPFDVVMLLLGQGDLAEGAQAATIVERTLAMHKICFDLDIPTICLGLPVDHRAATLHSFASRHLLVNDILKGWSLGEHESRWTLYVDCAKLMPYSGADYKKPEELSKENQPPSRVSETRKSSAGSRKSSAGSRKSGIEKRKSETGKRKSRRKSQAEGEESEEEEPEEDSEEDSDDDDSEDDQSEPDIEHIGPDGLGWWQPDGLHLTAAGAAVLGKKIAKEVEQFLRIQSVFRSAKKQTVQLTI
eukprot:gnl/MRDRNA2_/MRDRNA2_91954_c0_seq1.p1 gnl/MRDRNA2_/MRDRNA2_91954_c0~~gnl/MRDRNA2_/MRDRNA2_91954_c0_seq1.p1  ORF type:complete len:495 (+),score=110.85 gnl/MRDRNA2_/MRDRNA2_91954_c0_seq1:78-1487(+)